MLQLLIKKAHESIKLWQREEKRKEEKEEKREHNEDEEEERGDNIYFIQLWKDKQCKVTQQNDVFVQNQKLDLE